jgi:PAS domain S-box-containing protein
VISSIAPGTNEAATSWSAGGEGPFRALLEAAPDAMVIADDTGTIQLVNAQTESMFGYARAELLGRNVDVLVPERIRGSHLVHRASYAANRAVRPMGAGLDLYGLRRDGREFPVEISLSPLETTDGLLFSAAVRDVSDRKAAEQRINELAVIVESSQDAILTLALDGTITFRGHRRHRLAVPGPGCRYQPGTTPRSWSYPGSTGRRSAGWARPGPGGHEPDRPGVDPCLRPQTGTALTSAHVVPAAGIPTL